MTEQPIPERRFGAARVYSDMPEEFLSRLAAAGVFERRLEAPVFKRLQGGRGGAFLADLESDERIFLRNYLRGGLFGPLLKDRFFAGTNRALEEFRILRYLKEQGVHVPRPFAAVTFLDGPIRRYRLVTEALEGCRSASLVFRQTTDRQARRLFLTAIAREIAAMHRLGVVHADLNMDNIQEMPLGQVYLIDFDRARHTVAGDPAQLKAVARLNRSIQKWGLGDNIAFSERLAFLEELFRDEPPQVVEHHIRLIWELSARMLRWRRLFWRLLHPGKMLER